jgi:hypothetical protein
MKGLATIGPAAYAASNSEIADCACSGGTLILFSKANGMTGIINYNERRPYGCDTENRKISVKTATETVEMTRKVELRIRRRKGIVGFVSRVNIDIFLR